MKVRVQPYWIVNEMSVEYNIVTELQCFLFNKCAADLGMLITGFLCEVQYGSSVYVRGD